MDRSGVETTNSISATASTAEPTMASTAVPAVQPCGCRPHLIDMERELAIWNDENMQVDISGKRAVVIFHNFCGGGHFWHALKKSENIAQMS